MSEENFHKAISDLKDYIHQEFRKFDHKLDKHAGKIENFYDRINKVEDKQNKIETKINNKFSEIDKKIGAVAVIIFILAIAGRTIFRALLGG